MQFYSVQLKKKVEVPDSDVSYVTLKNGRRAATATMTHEGKVIKLFKIAGKAK